MTDTQRRLVAVIFLYTCIEGLVVNFFYPAIWAYLAKDAMIFTLFASQFLGGNSASNGSASRLLAPYFAFIGVNLLYLAVPTPVAPLGIAVALKQRLFYIPLVFAGYQYIRGDFDLAYLLRLIAWSSIPVSLFGIYLFFSGETALASMGADYSHTFYSTTGASGLFFYRVPGTFNSPGQFGGYLLTVGVLLVGFLLVSGLRKSDRRLILAALACAIPAMLATGSRAPMLFFMLLSGFTVIMSRDLGRAGVLGGLFYGLVLLSTSYLGAGVGDRFSSILSQENYERAAGTLFGQLWIEQTLEAPMGEGLARATVGARHFSPPGSVKLVESYLGIVSTETGVLGLLVFFLMIATIIGLLLPARRWMRLAPSRPIFNAAFLLVLANVILTTNGTGLDSIPLNLYFWFFIGVLLKLAELERARLTWRATGGPETAPQGAV